MRIAVYRKHLDRPRRNIHAILRRLPVPALVLAAALNPAAAAPAFEQLEQRFATLSADVYNYAASRDGAAVSVTGINTLKQAVDQSAADGNRFEALTLINANAELIKENIDEPAAADLVDRLLRHNAYVTAHSLYRHAETFAAPYAVSAIAYPFAQYHYRRGDWSRVIELLDGQRSDLGPDEADHSAILVGASLQKLKKHRESIKHYERVPDDSRHYPYAQLNKALAYLRQGWWTDAQLAINQALEAPAGKENDELANRLHLVLGYLLLKEGFYRDAREAFRNIHIDSRYANRALLGLGLSAAEQEDFVGALRVLNTLKEKGVHDLPSDETRFLLPYIYENLEQQMTASAGYNEAIAYYTRQIKHIDRLIDAADFYTPGDTPAEGDTAFPVGETDLLLSNPFPGGFLTDLRELERFNRRVNNTHLLKQVRSLHSDYRRAYNNAVRSSLEERRKYLESYRNQARYGLARLYDRSEGGGE
jgi:hypothetical protein